MKPLPPLHLLEVKRLFLRPGIRVKLSPYLFISPFFIAFAVFGLYPMLYGIWLSLNKGIDSMTFAGLHNYANVLSDSEFWLAMWHGTKLALASLLIITPLAMLVALLINRPSVVRHKGYFATFFFTPNITSAVAVSIIFSLVFDPDLGALNKVLSVFHIPGVQWLQSPNWTLPALVIVVTWRYLGINILYCLAALQNVSTDLIEAAKIDGASSWQRFWAVTLPAMRPIMAFIVFQAILGSFNMFTEAYLLGGQGNGPADSLVFPTIYIYQEAFNQNNFGYAAALGYVFTIIMLVISLVQLKFFRLREEN